MTKELQIFNVPECFYNPSNTNNLKPCDCDKIFFDVYIDFEKVRMVLCKDWYNMIFKNIRNEIPCVVEHKNTWYNTLESEKIRRSIVNYLIKTYLKTPVYEAMEYDRNYNSWGRHDFNMSIVLCERPSLTVYINPFKFISWYLLEDGISISATHGIYNRAINLISDILEGRAFGCKSLNYKKYDKFKDLLRKFKYSAYHYDNQKASILFNQVYSEYIKYFNN